MNNINMNRDSMVKRLFDAIVALNDVIINKYNTYHQLQKELKQSEQDYDRIISNIKSFDDSAEKNNIKTLHDKEIGLQKDLKSLDEKISSIDEQKKQIEITIYNLENDKVVIEHKIKERSLLISIIKYVFGDDEREESERIQEEIKKNKISKDSLIKTMSKLSFQKTGLERSQKDLQVELSRIQTKIKQLSDLKLAEARKRKDALSTLNSKKEQVRERKRRVQEEFDKKWISCLKNLDALCK